MPSSPLLAEAQALAEDFAVDLSYWQGVHRMEAEVEAFFDELVAELPEASTPYGRGFTAPMVLA